MSWTERRLAASCRNGLLILLLLGLASNYVDRVALGLLIQDIKVDLSLTDTQLGLLSGIAFALFYSLLGIPIARRADRGNRKLIITGATLVWSVAVMLCGAARSFTELLLIRVAVAAGEACFVPPALSLIADYFDRNERPRAVAIFKLGVPISLFVGYLLAGRLDTAYGWRATFVIVGAPGVLLFALNWQFLREPRQERQALARSEDESPSRALSDQRGEALAQRLPTLREVAGALWRNRTFCHLLVFYSVGSVFGWGLANWQPTFIRRSYGLGAAEVGAWMTLLWGGGGLVGTYFGGQLASRYFGRRERIQFRAMSVAYGAFCALMIGAYVTKRPYLSFLFTGLAFAGASAGNGPTFAALQSLVPERMRALAIAIVLMFSNLIGVGLGPLAAGALSDALMPRFGADSLRYALMALCPGYLWCALHLWLASHTVQRDLPGNGAQ